MTTATPYPSKVLLFGEYTVILGSTALAAPLPVFKGHWGFDENNEQDPSLKKSLSAFAEYLNQGDFPGFDMAAFRRNFESGLYFDSDIPLGYGAGSSGAVCAAMYDGFFKEKKTSPLELMSEFARMENHFHGASSGFDPLVCYLNQAVLKQGEEIRTLDRLPQENRLFLLDTGISRRTGPLVNIFMEKCKDNSYKEKCISELVPLADEAIVRFLGEGQRDLFTIMDEISSFQFSHFREMIPESLLEVWEKGLLSDTFKLKLCGAGGGGFLLGIVKESPRREKMDIYGKIIPISF